MTKIDADLTSISVKEREELSTHLVPMEPPRKFDSPLHNQGVLAPRPGRLAFVSGQVGVRADATTGDGVEEQTQIAFDNIARILAEASLDLSDLASLQIYLTSPDHINGFTQTARRCLGGHRPAATLVVVEQLANAALLVQIQATAVGH